MKRFTEREYDDPEHGHVMQLTLTDLDIDFAYEVSVKLDLNLQKSKVAAMRQRFKHEGKIALEEAYNEFVGAKK